MSNRVVVRGGMRTISNQQLERTREAMREVVSRHLPVTGATITSEAIGNILNDSASAWVPILERHAPSIIMREQTEVE